MDASLAGLLGTFLGAAIGLVGSLITNVFSIWKDREQRSNEEKIERERWRREQLQQIYSNSIYALSRVASPSFLPVTLGSGETKTTQEDPFHEAQKWLGLLLVYHPDHTRKAYFTLQEQILTFSSKSPVDVELARNLRDFIIRLAAEDPRLPT